MSSLTLYFPLPLGDKTFTVSGRIEPISFELVGLPITWAKLSGSCWYYAKSETALILAVANVLFALACCSFAAPVEGINLISILAVPPI